MSNLSATLYNVDAAITRTEKRIRECKQTSFVFQTVFAGFGTLVLILAMFQIPHEASLWLSLMNLFSFWFALRIEKYWSLIIETNQKFIEDCLKNR
jgi:hypothetical protein